MNSKERLDKFVNGEAVDRKPNLTIVGSVVTQYTGIGVDEYCKDIRIMPGCELPTTTNLENIKAITKALEALGA